MITLVLGGARSGKSAFAERLAAGSGESVTYVATAVVGDDRSFAERVAAHRARRPPGWATAECGPALAEWLEAHAGAGSGRCVLVESLGTWVAAHEDFDADADALCRGLVAWPGTVVVVSEEVGLGVHPSTAVGGAFRDALGRVNQAVSAVADRAYLVVAGRALALDPPPGGFG